MPLDFAARDKNLQHLKSLLPYYKNIKKTDDQGNTALHILVNHNVGNCQEYAKQCIDMLRDLISRGADVNHQNKNGWSPVHFAAVHCHLDMLKILKKNGADFHLRTVADETPLILACKYMSEMKDTPEEKKTIDFLIDRVPDLNLKDENGYTALHYAIRNCSDKIVMKLLKSGAYVHFRTKKHQLTPLHFAVMKKNNLPIVQLLLESGALVEILEIEKITPLHISLLEGSSNVVEYLIAKGADVNFPDRILGLTPVHLAIYQQRYDLFQLLIDKGADVNCSSEHGLTPLHLSAMLGCSQFTEALISLGAKVNCSSDNGLTPLHVASLMSHLPEDNKLVRAEALKHDIKTSLIAELLTYPHNQNSQEYETVIQMLIKNGADVNALTTSGCSSLHFAAKYGRHKDNFVKILLEYGALVDYKEPSSGYTALHYASQNNFDAIAKVLIRAGASLNALTQDGRTPVHLAAEFNCTAVLKILLKYGAYVDGKGTSLQWTPLHLALLKNCKDAATLLITAGADVNRATPDGRSPLHLASESNCSEVVEVLIDSGANVNHKESRLQLTPLHVALLRSSKKAASILIGAGADVNAVTSDGKSTICFTLQSNSIEDMKELLILLIECGANVNHTEPREQLRPLHVALIKKYDDIAVILMNAGAKINVPTLDGKMPIHLAAMSNCTGALKLMLENGVDVNCRENDTKLTPLHLALHENHQDATTILIDAGANVNSLTPDGKSPLHFAMESNSIRILRNMLKRGAQLNCRRKRCLYTFLYQNEYLDDEDLIDKLHDFGGISISLAIDSLKNRKIEQAVVLLRLIVDAFDESSCMPVDPKFKNVHDEKMYFLLKEYGVRINDLDAYWRLTSDRILSGIDREFRNSLKKSTGHLNYYLYMLKAAKLPLSDNYKNVKPRMPEYFASHELQLYGDKCIEEVRELKNYWVSASVTLYDVLHMKTSRRRFYMESLNLREIDRTFEIYDKLILARYREDKIKSALMETVQLAVYQWTSILMPITCIEKIFFDLNIMNIIATIDAAEMTD